MFRTVSTASLLIVFAAAPALAEPSYKLASNTNYSTSDTSRVAKASDGRMVQYHIGDHVPAAAYRIADFKAYNIASPQLGYYYARIGSDVVLVAERSDRIEEFICLVLTAD